MVLVMGTIIFIAQRVWHLSVVGGSRPQTI
jgi:hypothetical protein